MVKEYGIAGMSCGSCIAKVSDELKKIEAVKDVEVQLNYPQAKIQLNSALDLKETNSLLAEIGDYVISEEEIKKEVIPFPEIKPIAELPEKSISTYQPLILIVSFIAGVSALVQYPFTEISWMLWMRHFMAGFFLVFAFFKLLNIKGFSNSYQMYDIIAAKWKSWGLIYPFVELILGVFYLINIFPIETNIATAIILGVSSIGVIQSNLNKKKIKCACLGDVFNLPMSTVTIVEDLTMVGMAVLMLFVL